MTGGPEYLVCFLASELLVPDMRRVVFFQSCFCEEPLEEARPKALSFMRQSTFWRDVLSPSVSARGWNIGPRLAIDSHDLVATKLLVFLSFDSNLVDYDAE